MIETISMVISKWYQAAGLCSCFLCSIWLPISASTIHSHCLRCIGYALMLSISALPGVEIPFILPVLNLHCSFSFQLQRRRGGVLFLDFEGKFPTLSRDEMGGWTLD